jgi:hypothetical protein
MRGHIYIIGGHQMTGRPYMKKVCKDVDKYNPVTEELNSVGDLNQAQASHATFVPRGVLGVMGGHCTAPYLPMSSRHGRHATTFGKRYDPYHDKWVPTERLLKVKYLVRMYNDSCDLCSEDVRYIYHVFIYLSLK